MYTEEDRKIADDILNKIKRSHRVEESSMHVYLNRIYHRSEDDDPFETRCQSLWKEMIGMGLIVIDNHWLSLTAEGHMACELGITEYLRKFKENRELDIESKRTSVWNNYFSMVQITLYLIAALIGYLIAIL